MSDSILVDTSVVIAMVAEESPRAAILAATKHQRILAASSLAFEVCNALTAAMKKRTMSVQNAIEALTLFNAMTIDLVEPSFEDGIYLAAEYNLYGYDACVLVAARNANLPLLTLDRRMAEVARVIGVELVEL